MVQDVPGGTVHKNLPAIAGDGFNPWSQKIPHAAEQLNLRVVTTESECLRACAPQQEEPLQ